MINLGDYVKNESSTMFGTPFIGVFIWHIYQEITPILVPSAKSFILDLGVSPSYQISNLPVGVTLNLLKRIIHGKPVENTDGHEDYYGVSDILIKSMFGSVEESYRIMWYVTKFHEETTNSFLECENLYVRK